MAIATTADLKAVIAAFLNCGNLTVQIPTFIQLCESRIAYGSREGAFTCEPLRTRGMEAERPM